ncbi:MAG: transposase [Desulfuromonadales bacterium]|nr:transposase [Desulfuromonadales bacterium]
MSRKPRIHYPDAVYHVILRGNAGEQIFFEDRDRYRFYLLLQYAAEAYRCRIHAFCLMSNHLHLVIQVEAVPLTRIMQNISQRYTQWINRMRSRTGHVFQGRYKALLVDADAYLLELVRYVHLNPVRAGAAQTAADYPWTGHRGYLGNECLPWLTSDLVLSMLSPNGARARSAYAAFVQEGLGGGRRDAFHRGTGEGRILGDDAFVDDVLDRVNQRQGSAYTLDKVVDMVCAHYRLSSAVLSLPGKARPMAKARALAAAIVQASPHLRLTDLATVLERDLSALGKAAQRLTCEENARELVEQLVDELSSS